MAAEIELIEPLWEQQAGESTEWFKRFCRYRNQIGSRSLVACVNSEAADKGVQKRSTKAPGSWNQAKQKWRWDERVAAWDLYQVERQDAIWDERYKKWRESAWENSENLIKKA